MTTYRSLRTLHGLTPFRLAFGAVFLMLICVVNLPAQTSHSATDSRTPSGLEPGAPVGSFPLSGFDNINLYNGHLNFALPLFQVGGRGEAGYTITLPIERTWKSVVRTYYTGPGNCGSCQPPDKFPETDEWKGIENGFGAGVVVGRASRDRDPDPSINGGGVNYECNTLTRFTFTRPDGTELELRDYYTDGRPHRSWGSQRFPRGTVFIARDGSSTTFISDQAIVDVACNNDDPAVRWGFQRIFPNGYLLFKNGVRYRVLNGRVTSIQDGNGNQVTFGGGGVIDSLGRTALFMNGAITYQGVGGVERTISILRAPLSQSLRSDIPSTKTFRQLFPELMGGSDSSQFNPEVINAIVLPDGRRYTLRYNEYGELARVELPTGGAFEYEHAAGDASSVANASGVIGIQSQPIYRRAVEKRVYKNGGTGSDYESRTRFELGRVTQYDKNGNMLSRSIHVFAGSAYESLTTTTFIWYEVFNTGREIRTDILSTDGNDTLLSRTTNQYENYPHTTPQWWTDGYLVEWPRPQDPYLKETATLLPDTNQISKQVFNNDQYGNQTDAYVYDYGAGAAPTYPVRHTHTDYLTTNPANGIDYTSLSGPYQRGLLSALSVYAVNPANGGESLVAQNETRYDEAAYPLLTYGAVTGWTDPATGARGLATTKRSWLDTASTWLETHARYDQVGNPRFAWDAKGNLSEVEYSSAYHYAYPTHTISAVPDPTGERGANTSLESSTAYDFSSGKVTSTTDANGQITYPRYTNDNNVADPLDRLQRIEYPDGGVTKYNYFGAAGDLYLQAISYRGANQTNPVETRQYFDGLGRKTRAFLYDGTTAAPWLATDTYYDASGRVSNISNAHREAAPSAAAPSTCNLCTSSTYDALGRVRTVTTPDNAQITTNYSGNTVTVTDQAGRQRKSVSDALGRLTTVYEDPNASGYTGLNYQTNYTYDVLGNLRKVDQGGQLRYFMYDSLGRLVRAKNPEQNANAGLSLQDAFKAPEDTAPNDQWSLSYTYDLNGNPATKTDARGLTSTYSYDPLNRATAISYSDGTPYVGRVYDRAVNGRGHFAWHWTNVGQHTVVHNYDAMGRALAQSQHFWINNNWGAAYTTQRTYDKAGIVTSQTYPSGHTVNYDQFDAAGRLKNFNGNLGDGTLRTYATSITYDEANRMQEERFGTNTALYHKLHYNVRGQLYDVRLSTVSLATDRWNMNRGALVNFYSNQGGWVPGGSGTDNNGNIKLTQHWIPGDDQVSTFTWMNQYYDYDALNRISHVKEQANGSGYTGEQHYTYDRWGNRQINAGATNGTGIPEPQFDGRNLPATNRLYAPGDMDINDPNQRRIRYDAAGTIVYDSYTPESGTGARTYDAENRMTSMWDKYGTLASYAYDAEGRRTRRTTQSREVWQVYGVDGELVAEYAANAAATSPQKEYGYRNGELLLMAESTSSASLSTPTNLSAAPANAGTRITLGWGTVAGAIQYRVERATIKGGSFTLKGTTQTNAFMDDVVTSGQAYLYHVCAADTAGNCTSAYGNVALATAYGFADDPIITPADDPSGVTVTRVRALHVEQLRTTVNAVRAAAGLAAATWGEAVVGGVVVRAEHVRELRSKLSEALAELSLPVPSYTDATLSTGANGTSIKRAHFAELRLSSTRGSGASSAGGGSAPTWNFNWLVTDHLGTPRMIADLSGTLLGMKRHDYLPFGEEVGAGVGGRTAGQGYSQSDGVRQHFAGSERDGETGLDFMQARYYGSGMGRFLSVDPIFLKAARLFDPQRIPLYVYARNNPVKYFDPTGEDIHVKVTNTTTGQTTIKSRTASEIRTAQKEGIKPTHREMTVSTYRVDVTNDSGGSFSFNTTRDALHDNKDGTPNSPARGNYGTNGEAPPGEYRGRWVDSDATGRALRIYDPNVAGENTIRGPDGDRTVIQIHAGNCSEGCPLVRGTTVADVETQMSALQAQDLKNGKGTDIHVSIEDRNSPGDNFHVPETDNGTIMITPVQRLPPPRRPQSQ